MHTIQIRIDKQTKQSANKVLEKLGLDMSSAVKIYLRQITRTNGIPFPIITENGFTIAEEQQLIDQSNNTLRLYKQGKIKSYTTTKAMLKDILA